MTTKSEMHGPHSTLFGLFLRIDCQISSLVTFECTKSVPLLWQLACHGVMFISTKHHGLNNIENAFFLHYLTPSLPCHKSIIPQAYHHCVMILEHMKKRGIYAQNAYASRQREMPLE